MESAAARTLVRSLRLLSVPALAALLGACVAEPPLGATRNQVIISVRDQKLTLVKEDHTRLTFPISTSKYGLGDSRGKYTTPTGELAVAQKIGGGAPAGTVFHGRVSTGEIVKIDAPGRDAIVTRILALRGLEKSNQQAFARGIYIHGTPEERNIGRPTSYGCIRMRSRDVITLFDMVKIGARVQIIDTTMNQAVASNILTPSPGSSGSAPAQTITPPVVGNNATLVASSAPTTAPPPGASTPAGASTAVVTPGAGKPGAETSAANASAPAKKVWAGAPSKLLAKQAATDAKARKDAHAPVGAPVTARPVSNEGGSSDTLHRSVFDSL